MKVLLTIAGHDPLHSAGLTADLKIFHLLGFHGVSAPSCWTVQDPDGCREIHPTPADLLARILARLHGSLNLVGVKLGLLPIQNAQVVGDFLERLPKDLPVMLDPVLAPSHGEDFITRDDLGAYIEEVVARADWLTPNRKELTTLAGSFADETEKDPDCGQTATQARRLLDNLAAMGGKPKGVVVTGARGSKAKIGDLLVTHNGESFHPSPARSIEKDLHGTGCHFSSALLGNLVQGMDIKDAVVTAQGLLHELVETSRLPTEGRQDLFGGR